MKFSELCTDPEKENEGIWSDLGAGFEVLVARTGNKNYKRLVAKLSKPHVQAFKARTIEGEVLEEITMEAIAKTVLLDWKNLQGDDGKDIPYSPEKAVELFKKSGDFYNMVCEIGADRTNFQEVSAAQDLEN